MYIYMYILGVKSNFNTRAHVLLNSYQLSSVMSCTWEWSMLKTCFLCSNVLHVGFIRKVYLTLMVQLLITVGIICAFLYW